MNFTTILKSWSIWVILKKLNQARGVSKNVMSLYQKCFKKVLHMHTNYITVHHTKNSILPQINLLLEVDSEEHH